MTALAERVKEKSGSEPYGFDWRWVPMADLSLEELPDDVDWREIVHWLNVTFDGEAVVTVDEDGDLTAFLCVNVGRNDRSLHTDTDDDPEVRTDGGTDASGREQTLPGVRGQKEGLESWAWWYLHVGVVVSAILSGYWLALKAYAIAIMFLTLPVAFLYARNLHTDSSREDR